MDNGNFSLCMFIAWQIHIWSNGNFDNIFAVQTWQICINLRNDYMANLWMCKLVTWQIYICFEKNLIFTLPFVLFTLLFVIFTCQVLHFLFCFLKHGSFYRIMFSISHMACSYTLPLQVATIFAYENNKFWLIAMWLVWILLYILSWS